MANFFFPGSKQPKKRNWSFNSTPLGFLPGRRGGQYLTIQKKIVLYCQYCQYCWILSGIVCNIVRDWLADAYTDQVRKGGR
jgi:hypothetical protein